MHLSCVARLSSDVGGGKVRPPALHGAARRSVSPSLAHANHSSKSLRSVKRCRDTVIGPFQNATWHCTRGIRTLLFARQSPWRKYTPPFYSSVLLTSRLAEGASHFFWLGQPPSLWNLRRQGGDGAGVTQPEGGRTGGRGRRTETSVRSHHGSRSTVAKDKARSVLCM